jgi:hypothetical protein
MHLTQRSEDALKKTAGSALWIAGHSIQILTLIAALIYGFGLIFWGHASAIDAIKMIALAACAPLAAAWLMRTWGRILRNSVTAMHLSSAKKWLFAGAAIVIASTGIILVEKAYTSYQCATDPSRSTPAAEAEARRNGFRSVCEIELSRYDMSFDSLTIVLGRLAFTPVDLSRTPFSEMENLGGKAETISDIPSRLYRGFQMPDGHRLTLSEDDMSATGAIMYRRPADEPERINGLPARLDVVEAAPGRAVSALSWVEGRRSYQLWLDANAASGPLRNQMFALAASLPKSVPSCPNEKLPTPIRMGANGWPVLEPPEAMTQADMDALFKKKPRSCK